MSEMFNVIQMGIEHESLYYSLKHDQETIVPDITNSYVNYKWNNEDTGLVQVRFFTASLSDILDRKRDSSSLNVFM